MTRPGRPTPKRPEDYARCPGCGRLVEKKIAKREGNVIDGKHYGRECAPKAREALAARQHNEGVDNPA